MTVKECHWPGRELLVAHIRKFHPSEAAHTFLPNQEKRESKTTQREKAGTKQLDMCTASDGCAPCTRAQEVCKHLNSKSFLLPSDMKKVAPICSVNRISQWPGQPSRAERCSVGKASDFSHTNPRWWGAHDAQGLLLRRVGQIDFHVENPVKTRHQH